jgi:hypothetical protein
VQWGAKQFQSVFHDAGEHVKLLLYDERYDGLLLLSHHGHVHVRDDRQGRLRYFHLWRQQVLRDDPVLLRLHEHHDEGRLHLLPRDEYYARLLRLEKELPGHCQDTGMAGPDR